jgi:hypothetical protein
VLRLGAVLVSKSSEESPRSGIPKGSSLPANRFIMGLDSVRTCSDAKRTYLRGFQWGCWSEDDQIVLSQTLRGASEEGDQKNVEMAHVMTRFYTPFRLPLSVTEGYLG